MSNGSDAGRGAAARAFDIVEQVQVFGLASAAVVAERYIGAVDRYLAQRAEPVETSRQDRDTAPTLARLEQAMVRSLDAVASGVSGTGWVRPGRAAPAEVLHLPAVRAGATARTSVWVHNPTAVPVPVTARLSALTAADGHVLPSEAVMVTPERSAESGSSWPAEVAPGGSCEVRVEIHVPADTPPGHFHAVVTSTATPRQALPVRLEVRAAEEPR